MVRALRKVGLITIGQSPRADITSEIKNVLGSNVEILECGALDGLTHDEIKRYMPIGEEDLLVTRLRDGVEVKVSSTKIVPLIQSCIKSLEDKVEIIGILCTGEFPHFSSKRPLIEPSLLLINVVKSLGVSKLGVFVPDPKQLSKAFKKWGQVTSDIKVVAVSPYSGSMEALGEAAISMGDRDLIVLDCMGYNSRIKRLVWEVTRKPVILPRTLMAGIMKELLET